MPEGPEIRRAADRVAAAIEGKTADDVFFAFERLKRFEAELTGQRIQAVTSRGKAMLIRFAGGLSIYSHNQLYGRWYVMRNGGLPATRRQLRVAQALGGRTIGEGREHRWPEVLLVSDLPAGGRRQTGEEDYWDSAGGLLEHVPALGWMLRRAKRGL